MIKNRFAALSLLLFAVVAFWAFRLTANWAYNFESFEYQDWRYVLLRQKSGKLYGFVNFFGIHLFPTIVVYLCILPAVTVVHEGALFQPWCIVFIAISFLAVIFQGIADIQMHAFRNSGTAGFIYTGLWKKSRHPNYACEILIVSIPLADKHQARKPGFEEYKKSTRML